MARTLSLAFLSKKLSRFEPERANITSIDWILRRFELRNA
jgi:hypothetical protein